MAPRYRLLVLGASYGSLFAAKVALAGHSVHMVCLPEEADIVNRDGAVVRLPLRGRAEPLELNTKTMPGRVTAGCADEVIPEDYDLVVLAMQEPQYADERIKRLIERVGAAEKPCLSLMNMPPLVYLRRIARVDVAPLRSSYTDANVWNPLEPHRVSLCSPDAQAFRPPGEAPNVLQVGLPTNFKAAPFESLEHTAILEQIERDVEGLRHEVDGRSYELPVKLRLHRSKFVPLAKWAMLIAGNYRCVQEAKVIPIRRAVHDDLETSREVYEWTSRLCVALGADSADLVPFWKYAEAAKSLTKPSSVARAISSGAVRVERVDKLVQSLGRSVDLRSAQLDRIVSRVDARLEHNRNTPRVA